jgi:sugar phosphate isomerase/epimerase
MAMKLALDLATLEQPPAEALKTAAGLGVEGVVIDARGDFAPARLSQTGLRQLRKVLADGRLRVAAVRFRTRRGYYDAGELDARVAATKKTLEMAYALGAGTVLNYVGRVPAPDSADWNMLREVLNDLGRFGHRVGALLAAETGPDAPADLARLLAALEPAALMVDLDPGALLINGHSPQDAVGALNTAIRHVELTDARTDSSWGRGRFVPLGEGTADLPSVLSALEAHDYRGWLTIRPTDEGHPVDQASQAIQYLRSL